MLVGCHCWVHWSSIAPPSGKKQYRTKNILTGQYKFPKMWSWHEDTFPSTLPASLISKLFSCPCLLLWLCFICSPEPALQISFYVAGCFACLWCQLLVFPQNVSLCILISILGGGLLQSSAVFEAVLFVLHAFFEWLSVEPSPTKHNFFSMWTWSA